MKNLDYLLIKVSRDLESYYEDKDEYFYGEHFLRSEYEVLIWQEILSLKDPEQAEKQYKDHLSKIYFFYTGEEYTGFNRDFNIPTDLEDLYGEFTGNYLAIKLSFEDFAFYVDDVLDFEGIPENSLYYFMLAYYKQKDVWERITELKCEQAEEFGRFIEILNPEIRVEMEILN